MSNSSNINESEAMTNIDNNIIFNSVFNQSTTTEENNGQNVEYV